MNIIKTKTNSALVLELEGRLDTTTAPELETVVKSLDEDITSLVFDFQKLEYISSAGLRVLLYAQKTMNVKGNMVVKNCNEEILEVFDITGFSDILSIE